MSENNPDAQKPVGGTPEQQTMILGTLASGQVVIDRLTSHLHDAPGMMELLQEAFAHISLNGEDFAKVTVDFQRPIGESVCVGTSESDNIVFAQRERRAGLTRFVKDRTPEPTTMLTVILRKGPKDPNKYIVMTAFQGAGSEREPWDPYAAEASKQFWSSHALLWGSEKVMPGTETSGSPSYWERMPVPPNAPAQFPPAHELRITIPTT